MQKTSYYHTLAVILTGLLCFYYFTRINYLLIACLLTGIVAVIFPGVAKIIHWGWFKLSIFLGGIVSIVWFSIIFYLLIFPLKVLKSVFSKKDKLSLKHSDVTLFQERVVLYTPSHFKNSW